MKDLVSLLVNHLLFLFHSLSSDPSFFVLFPRSSSWEFRSSGGEERESSMQGRKEIKSPSHSLSLDNDQGLKNNKK